MRPVSRIGGAGRPSCGRSGSDATSERPPWASPESLPGRWGGDTRTTIRRCLESSLGGGTRVHQVPGLTAP
ncbi:hypothetical protein NDU88_006143 [Pleurodeles waltl]|uniref:Uncharacterized protein n=1 Tax=Pleurodeles waltl TaxID=8319 RepID=A0AAV7LRL0_PLEWA|nr:hypothetical protein NDU88_006143 [Pleurodeles waltl]